MDASTPEDPSSDELAFEAAPVTVPARNGAGGALWALTSYFNPLGYRRRIENYRQFRARLGAPLATVELGYGGRYDLGSGDGDILEEKKDIHSWPAEGDPGIVVEPSDLSIIFGPQESGCHSSLPQTRRESLSGSFFKLPEGENLQALSHRDQNMGGLRLYPAERLSFSGARLSRASAAS
jgi:hypothetical protein